MIYLIVAAIVFIIADLVIRMMFKKAKQAKVLKEREKSLEVALNLDFSRESKTLKRTEVENPKAKILCVDDEDVILDSFRKILVLDGFSVDTVNTGQEALFLVQSNHYDFVFTDLKMPTMNGVDVAKSVKHLRPDIDVVIVTGYATVETAVEVMKHGASDYMQKPFTEDELLAFINKAINFRKEKIKHQLRSRIKITHADSSERSGANEFSIPGGVFISEGHCWLNIQQDGSAKIGMDDFSKKIIGSVDDVDFPTVGTQIKAGSPLFIIRQGDRKATFKAPISGIVTKINNEIKDEIDLLDFTTYKNNWFVQVDSNNLDEELQNLKIGNTAVQFYQAEIDELKKWSKEYLKQFGAMKSDEELVDFNKLDNRTFDEMVYKFIR